MKRIFFLFFIIISLFIISNCFVTIYGLWHKKDVLIQAQNELKKVQQENSNLKTDLLKTKNPEFIEQQSRDKLFFIKPGENTIIIPKNLLPTSRLSRMPTLQKQNWKKWINVFGY